MNSGLPVLVTGANGFVGTAVLQRLTRDTKYSARAAVRDAAVKLAGDPPRFVVGAIDPNTDWRETVRGAHAVIHLAARVHVMRDTSADPLSEFRRVNVEGTLNLARQAAAAGVKRFVFVSSIKVNGESGRFRESDAPAPGDPYGISKHEAEIGLRAIAAETGMEATIVRPPLVYGPGVKANFRALVKIIARGIPLPVGAIHNRRSLVAVDNLADFLARCVDEPRAANETFLVSDGEDLSTHELVRRIGRALGRPARTIPVPVALLSMAGAITGRGAVIQRLVGSLELDITRARTLLNWTPPISVDEGLTRATRDLVPR